MAKARQTKDEEFFIEHEDFFIMDGTAHVDAWSPALGRALKKAGRVVLRLRDWQHDDLKALVACAEHVVQVHVECEIANVSALAEFPRLRALYLRSALSTIDFSRMPSLDTVGYSGESPDFGSLDQAPSLRTLGLTGCNLRDLDALSGLTTLEAFRIREAPLRWLKGIEGLRSLRRLVLAQVPLETLDGLRHASDLSEVHLAFLRIPSIAELTQLRHLTKLSVWSCRKVKDLERIGELVGLEELDLGSMKPLPPIEFLAPLKKVKSLRLEGVGKIASLEFLRGFRELEVFNPFDTTVEDGDMSVLLELPALREVRYAERRHYRPRRDEVEAAVAKRKGVEEPVRTSRRAS